MNTGLNGGEDGIASLYLEDISISSVRSSGELMALVTVTLNRTSDLETPVSLFQMPGGVAVGLPAKIVVPPNCLSGSLVIGFAQARSYNYLYATYGGWTQLVVYTPPVVPPQVDIRITDLHAVPGGNLIRWNGHGNPTYDELYEGYCIHRSEAGSSFRQISGLYYDAFFLDAHVTAGVVYAYRVVLKSKLGEDRVAESAPIKSLPAISNETKLTIEQRAPNELIVSILDRKVKRATFFLDGFRVGYGESSGNQFTSMVFDPHSMSFGKHELRALIGGISEPFRDKARFITRPVAVECGGVANGSLIFDGRKRAYQLAQIKCDLPSDTVSWKCEIFDDKGSLIKRWAAAGSRIKFCIDLEPRLTPRDPKHLFRITRTVQSSGEVLVAFEQEF